MTRLRHNVSVMSAYVPGEQPAAGARVLKLNTNENPYPPSPRVAEAIAKELAAGAVPGERLRLYSDPLARELRQAAADVTGFPAERIVAGNGSDELLSLVVRAVVGEGESLAFPYPTYVLYETLASAQAGRVRTVDFGADFGFPEALFGIEAKVVFVASPNSPSGTLHAAADLARLADSLSGLLVVDEAYVEFASESALSLARKRENVVVLRTLSKSHSLAGLRVGLLFGPAWLVEGVGKVKDSYNLDRLAIVGGAAALRDVAHTEASVERVRATRERLSRGLAERGFSVLPSEANFVLARANSAADAERRYRGLKERGVLVRYFPMRLLDDALRITVGTDSEIQELFEALDAVG